MTTRNILTIRERRVLTALLKSHRDTATDPQVHHTYRRLAGEIADVLEQVIDSATIPDEQWRSKYLAADAAKWNGEVQ